MTTSLRRHPRFPALCEAFNAHAEWFTPWSGTLFRFQTMDFPDPNDILSGRGAALHGGRWNPPGFPTVYGSTTDTAALEESKANDRYYGILTQRPRIVVAVDAQLQRLLDLTSPDIRRALGLTLEELASEDWRKLMAAGRESLSQCIGRAVAEVAASGILVRSAAVRQGVNGVVFRGVCHGDYLRILNEEDLQRLRNPKPPA